MTEETKKKISEATKGRTAWNKGKKCPIKNKRSYKYYNNGVINKRIYDDEIVPEGFKQGRIVSEESSKKAKLKREQTCLEKYGDAHYNKSNKPIQNKSTQDKRTSNGKAYRNVEQARKTCLERYGVENVFQLKEVKDKIKQRMVEKYGVEHNSQSQEWKDKIKQTWANKTSTEMNDIVEKRKNTLLDLYGVENIAKSEECIERIRQTCLEKYRVDYFCMTNKCRSHSSNESAPNKAFAELLSNNDISFEREFPLNRKSYDFKVGNNLIEINPFATHNSTWGIYDNVPMKKEYHYDKSKNARDNDYRCICVWDWDNVDKIISLLKPRQTIYARKCIIKEVDNNIAKEYINKYHLQNYVKSSINIALYYNDDIASIMTFGKPRYNKNYQYELIRYCSNYNVIGGAEKLFSYFTKKYNPISIISYCDLSKFNGDTYEKLNFKLQSISISKHWFNIKTSKHITDNLLRSQGFDRLFGKEYGYYGKGTSNNELMLKHGFVEIYDCGQATYVLDLE